MLVFVAPVMYRTIKPSLYGLGENLASFAVSSNIHRYGRRVCWDKARRELSP